MVLPSSLPMLLTHGANKTTDENIKAMLADPDNDIQNLIRLSHVCKVLIKFNRPITVYTSSRHVVKDVTEYIFNGFFSKDDSICYRFKSNARHGQFLPLSAAVSYEPVISTIDIFTSFEQFRKKFDSRFITEELIKQLWEEKSVQTGLRYAPSDFRSISKFGKEALRKFLPRFKGVEDPDRDNYTERKGYDGKPYFIMDSLYYGSGGSHTSRDIRVSHQFGLNRVFYCSEQTGGGREHNGILVTPNTYLWLEDD